MEINLLLFIPIMGLSRVPGVSNLIGIKYFFVQSLASIILLIGLVIIINLSWNLINVSRILSLRLVWKLGIPPFHLWIFNIIIDLDWGLFFIIASWQKILPFYFLSQVVLEIVDYIIIFSIYISIRGSLFQASIKKILILSSIFTRAWVIASIISIKIWWMYIFLLYRIILFFCSIIFYYNKIIFLERNNFYTISIQGKFNIFFLLLSMAGIPPFLGFFIKLLILFTLIYNIKLYIAFFLIMSSIIIIYIYLRIFLTFMITQRIFRKNILFIKISNFFRSILLIYTLSPIIFFTQ